jgi:Zn-dependent protease with chaperone function
MKTEPTISTNFKKRIYYSILSIMLFFLVYIFLVIICLKITTTCFWGGITIIKTNPSILTILLGIGILSFGAIIILFLFKFLFRKHKIDRSHLIEINENQEPEIFEIIKEVVLKVDTDFPNKVYLSHEVNASVFYDSNFWSMLFPIKKNLLIGVGLINTTTTEELKAILGHEFGHFSQKSMRIGSYVYNVNYILHNLLFDDEKFNERTQVWAGVSTILSIFSFLTFNIINKIKWILAKTYYILNIQYNALSREMEFHADEIAAKNFGSIPLINALRRMELSTFALQITLDFYENKILEGYKSENIFPELKYVLVELAINNKIKVENSLPLIDSDFQNQFIQSKINIKDRWASHPPINEREKALTYYLKRNKEVDSNHASSKFQNLTNYEIQLTNQLFENYTKNKLQNFKLEFFKSEFSELTNKGKIPSIFNGYYDNKIPISYDESNSNNYFKIDVNKLFNNEAKSKLLELQSLEQDQIILEQIELKYIQIKNFEYDGEKYKSNKAGQILEKVKNRILEISKEIEIIDRQFFFTLKSEAIIQGKKEIFETEHKKFKQATNLFDNKNKLVEEFYQATQFIQFETEFTTIKSKLKALSIIEQKIKVVVKHLLNDPTLNDLISTKARQELTKYIEKDLLYFNIDTFIDNNLKIMFTAIHEFSNLNNQLLNYNKIDLLNFLATLIKIENPN